MSVEFPSNAELQARKAAATPRGVGVMCDFYAARAENAELWDVEGRRFIDFAGGIAVQNSGHRHPKVVAAIAAQLQAFIHTCYQVVPYAGYVELAEALNRLTPGAHAKKTAFFSTGAEAVENAVKIARAATGRSGLIAFSGGFHGRTMMGMALTGKVVPYKTGFGPFPGEVYHASFPCLDVSEEQALASLHQLFKADIDPRRVAAVIIEPVQGEGGFYITPKAFMKALRRLCDEQGMLLIADEIQTGFGRTGTLFAMEQYGVDADLMCIAKSLAGGLPLSAVTGRAELMDAPAPGGLGGTYAGNPLAIAAAQAVIGIMDEEKLPERGAVLGAKLMAHLRGLQAEVPRLAEVRGLGSMVAAEFRGPDGGADAEACKRVQAEALKRGLILLSCGVNANVLRFLFPLTIPDAVFEEALGLLAEALRAA
ncbi:MAG: 4-aminobutyrate--2-oxoglutarate transaminase [Gammaproteobacteria bacterium]|nr:4-aminobutyrate--2-oxoglutarate transaminase [Gammaproteobacteria bacterium]